MCIYQYRLQRAAMPLGLVMSTLVEQSYTGVLALVVRVGKVYLNKQWACRDGAQTKCDATYWAECCVAANQ